MMMMMMMRMRMRMRMRMMMMMMMMMMLMMMMMMVMMMMMMMMMRNNTPTVDHHPHIAGHPDIPMTVDCEIRRKHRRLSWLGSCEALGPWSLLPRPRDWAEIPYPLKFCRVLYV